MNHDQRMTRLTLRPVTVPCNMLVHSTVRIYYIVLRQDATTVASRYPLEWTRTTIPCPVEQLGLDLALRHYKMQTETGVGTRLRDQ